MNATQDTAAKSASRTAPRSLATTSHDSHKEQREKNKRYFQAKCDAMLYIIEFIATFHLRSTANDKQTQKMEELKSLVVQTRKGLNTCQTGRR